MQETLGKRIAFRRKNLGLTQEQLAEKLGVTAQAVSKWENDQSCPDITTLPKLAEIFDVTTDELLGVEPKKLVMAEVIPQEEKEGSHFEFRFDDEKKDHNLEVSIDGGRKGGIGIALWLLLTAGLLFLSEFRYDGFFRFWDCLWPSGLLIFGLLGLYPRFSVIRLGCVLFSGYYILNMFTGVMLKLNQGMGLALLLLMFGLSLLVDALRKNKKGGIHIHGPKGKMVNSFDCTAHTFTCSTCFGENHHRIPCTRLSQGEAEVAFGELTVDVTGCEEFAPECSIELDCSFGELRLLVPRTCRVIHNEDKAFGDLEILGEPDIDASATLILNCDVSFGQITIQYV